MNENLITIGELAARTGLGLKALRLYGARDLLPPAQVDERSGARRYGPAETRRAGHIALLRAAGLPLARIAEVLDADGEDLGHLLDVYRREQEATHAARLTALSYAREVLSGRTPTMFTVAERDLPRRHVLCIRRSVSAHLLADFLAEASETLFGHLLRTRSHLSGPVFAVYHSLVSEDCEGTVEVCVPTDGPVDPGGSVESRIESASREAYVALPKRHGGYQAMAAAHDAVGAWLIERGHARSGPNREVYYPRWADAADGEHVVDVAVPFCPRAA
ncbi:MerR family transcriptional regulator [Kitasatospora sp. NPDC051853]|uniref:MerR family transcriptional regulator n=1 Tax=Kitasatospora sp. NPDC051853 TaxID=3364058 RepID=UPI00378E95F7